jgi:hypothetical protein
VGLTIAAIAIDHGRQVGEVAAQRRGTTRADPMHLAQVFHALARSPAERKPSYVPNTATSDHRPDDHGLDRADGECAVLLE